MKTARQFLCMYVCLGMLFAPAIKSARTQKQGPVGNIIPTCGSACSNPGSGLDDVYYSVAQTHAQLWAQAKAGTFTASGYSSYSTSLQIMNNHAAAIGNNSSVQAVLTQIQGQLSNPSAAFISNFQTALHNYAGMTVTVAALTAWFKAEGPAMAAIVTQVQSSGMASVETDVVNQIPQIASLWSGNRGSGAGGFMLAKFSGRHMPRLFVGPDPVQRAVDDLGFIAAAFGAAALLGCEPCAGISAAAAVAATGLAVLNDSNPFDGLSQDDIQAIGMAGGFSMD